jgi:hypothetical protein
MSVRDRSAYVKAVDALSKVKDRDYLFQQLYMANPAEVKQMTNVVPNGNFDSVAGWSTQAATISVANNVASCTGNGLAIYPQIFTYTPLQYVTGHKLYVRSKVRVTNDNAYALYYMVYAAGVTTLKPTIALHPAKDNWYHNGVVVTASDGASADKYRLYICHEYASAEASNSAVMEVQKVIMLDLTEIFGAGNEPDAATMDAILDLHDESGWFDGAQSIGVPIAQNANKVLRYTGGSFEFVDLPEPVRVILPDKYCCVVGDNFQLFYRGVVEAVNPYQYDIRISYDGSHGKAYPRYFELTPEAEDIGTHTLTIIVQTQSGFEVGRASTTIEIAAVGSAPDTAKNVLCIGDSLTSAGTWVIEAARRILGAGGTPVGHELANINFIGTRRDGSVGWEGYGGWTWDHYLAEPSATTLGMWVYAAHDKDGADQHSLWADANSNIWQLETIEATRLKFTRYESHMGVMPAGAGTLTHSANAAHQDAITFTSTVAADGNPFWNGVTEEVDFIDYCTRNGYAGIDYVYTLLTWNGLGPYRATAADHAALVASAKQLIDKIHTQYPNAKVKIMGIQLPSLNGGLATNYGASGGYSEVYGNIRTVFGMNLAYQAWANESAYSDFVEFINLSGQFDSENNMSSTIVPVNTRNAATELRGTNGVHPALAGYLQIADAAYRNMIARITV